MPGPPRDRIGAERWRTRLVAGTGTAPLGGAFTTAMGHTRESYAEPLFRAHLLAGLRWAAGI